MPSGYEGDANHEFQMAVGYLWSAANDGPHHEFHAVAEPIGTFAKRASHHKDRLTVEQMATIRTATIEEHGLDWQDKELLIRALQSVIDTHPVQELSGLTPGAQR